MGERDSPILNCVRGALPLALSSEGFSFVSFQSSLHRPLRVYPPAPHSLALLPLFDALPLAYGRWRTMSFLTTGIRAPTEGRLWFASDAPSTVGGHGGLQLGWRAAVDEATGAGVGHMKTNWIG